MEIGDVSSKTAQEIEEAQEVEHVRIIEAVFFVSGKFLSLQELMTLTDLNPIVIKETISKLQEKYEKMNSSLEIVERNNLWKMDVKSEFLYLVNKIAEEQKREAMQSIFKK